MVGARRVGLEGGAPNVFALFFPLPLQMSFFLISLGVFFVELWPGPKRHDSDPMRHVHVLETICGNEQGNSKKKQPSQRRTEWVTHIPELAEMLSATCEGEDVHARAGRGLTGTERYPPGMAAAILKAIRCQASQSMHWRLERDETDVDAGWENWETTNEKDGKPEFCDAYTGVILNPIAVGTARKEGGTSVCRRLGCMGDESAMDRPQRRLNTQQTCKSGDTQN